MCGKGILVDYIQQNNITPQLSYIKLSNHFQSIQELHYLLYLMATVKYNTQPISTIAMVFDNPKLPLTPNAPPLTVSALLLSISVIIAPSSPRLWYSRYDWYNPPHTFSILAPTLSREQHHQSYLI